MDLFKFVGVFFAIIVVISVAYADVIFHFLSKVW